MITITVNGQTKEIDAGTNLAQLLKQLQLNAECVAVECNLDVVERDAFTSVLLMAGDKLEVVQFVGGG